ncbi:hypothetical protein [Lonepinella sp. MS14436]|uniref:hypothetical protein n=1 Tax=Lonepinella sp. MS14436 TaxID=3003619 RepID=UPI0036D83DBF
MGQQKAGGNYNGVLEQSGLFAGDGGYGVKAQKVDLVGGAISGRNPAQSILITNSVNFRDIENYSDSRAQSFSLSAGINRSEDHYVEEKAVQANGHHQLSNAAVTPESQTGQTTTRLQSGEVTLSSVIPSYMSTHNSERSLTRATLTDGMLILNKDSHLVITRPQAIGINTELGLANEQVKAQDPNKLQEQQALSQSIGQLGAMAAGEFSRYMQWEEGSWQKVALHAALGAASAEAGGGNVAAGAVAGGTGEILNTQVADYLATQTALSPQARKTLQQLSAAGIGAAAGNLVGGNADNTYQGMNIAHNAEVYNRQLHPNETKWIKDNAKRFAEQQGITEAEAEQRLAQQVQKDIDILWFLKMDDNVDRQALNFVAEQKERTFVDAGGDIQHYFTAKNNDFWTPRKYAKEAYVYNERSGDKFVERNLHSGIVRSAAKGLKDKTGNVINAVSENKMETAKTVAHTVWEGTKECAGAPLDCAGGFVKHIATTGVSSGSEMIKNLFKVDQKEINALYNGDMEMELAVVSSSQFLGVAAEAVGAGKLAKTGGTAVVNAATKVTAAGAKVVEKSVKAVEESLARGTSVALNNKTLVKVPDEVSSTKSLPVVGETANYQLSEAKVNEIVLIEKGKRPDPSTYLPKEYIEQHLAKFDNGAVRITSLSSVKKYGTIGPENGGFVMPKQDFDLIVKHANGNLRLLEKYLGLDQGVLSNADTGVFYIPKDQFKNLRMPTGNEGGANQQWIPGGNTSGGVSEAVMDFQKSTRFHRLEIK